MSGADFEVTPFAVSPAREDSSSAEEVVRLRRVIAALLECQDSPAVLRMEVEVRRTADEAGLATCLNITHTLGNDAEVRIGTAVAPVMAKALGEVMAWLVRESEKGD